MAKSERAPIVDAARTAASGPVTLETHTERSDDGIIVEYELSSSADIPVVAQFEDILPEEYTDVGFNPETPPDEWWMDENEVTILQTIEPDDPSRLELGVIVENPTDPVSDRPIGIRWASREEYSADPLVRNPADQASSGREDDSDDPFDTDAFGAEIDRDTFDNDPVDDPFGDWPPENVEPTSDGGWGMATESPATGSEVAAEPLSDESVVSRLVDELEAGNLSDDERAVLADAFGPSNSEEVRLRHVQSRMDDFAAYVDVFEEFIDDHGTFHEFAEDVEGDVEAVREIVEPFDETLAEIKSEQEEIREELQSIQADLEAHEEVIEGELEDMRAEVDEFANIRTNLASALGVSDES